MMKFLRMFSIFTLIHLQKFFTYYDLTEEEKFDVLSKVKGNLNAADFSNDITNQL
jgi:hypothetical protein